MVDNEATTQKEIEGTLEAKMRELRGNYTDELHTLLADIAKESEAAQKEKDSVKIAELKKQLGA